MTEMQRCRQKAHFSPEKQDLLMLEMPLLAH